MFIDNKTLKKVIPYFGPILIMLGYVKLNLFYNHFGIKIVDYLEFTEILTLFLPDIVYFSSILFFVFIFDFLTKDEIEITSQDNIKDEIISTHSFKKRIKLNYKLNTFLFWFSLLIMIGFLIKLIWFRETLTFLDWFYLMVPTLLIFMIIMLEYRYKYYNTYGEKLNPSYNNYILILFFYTLFSVFYTFTDIDKTENRSDKTISFLYLDTKIQTDESLIFIGNTKNYLFIHNKKKNKSFVFNRSDIKDLQITLIKRDKKPTIIENQKHGR